MDLKISAVRFQGLWLSGVDSDLIVEFECAQLGITYSLRPGCVIRVNGDAVEIVGPRQQRAELGNAADNDDGRECRKCGRVHFNRPCPDEGDP